jgi:DNA repair protein RadD
MSALIAIAESTSLFGVSASGNAALGSLTIEQRIILRLYQQDALKKLRQSYRTGHVAPLLVLPTGSGKTELFVFATVGALGKSSLILIVVHRRELLRQAVNRLVRAGVTCGIIAANFKPDPDQAVQVCSIQTIARRLHQLPKFDLIVLDECHHAVAGQWKALVASQPQAKLLGVTATAARLDGKGLGVDDGGIFDDIIVGAEVAALIADGYLAPALCYLPAHHIDLRGVRVRRGDYDVNDLEQAVAQAGLTGNAIEQYRKCADHQPAICFCVSIRHAQDVAEAFRDEGYRAEAVSGKTPKVERDRIINGLGNASVEIVCSCSLIDEGLDVPAVGCVILLRPTKSIVLHRQQIGRGMRPAEGKTALIVLDHASNCLSHGLPESRVEWTLKGVRKRKKAPATDWQCPQCECLNPAGSRVCAGCGLVREIETPDRADVGRDSGDMALLDQQTLEALRNIRQSEFCSVPRTEAELTIYARAHGYHRGWVSHRLRSQPEIPAWLADVPPP